MMNNLSGIRPVYALDDFWNTSAITWGAIWAAFFHYMPILWKNRKLITKEFQMFYKFYFILFCWIHSDFFFILAVCFTKFNKKSMANMCGKQAMRTIGTFPLLVILSEYGNHMDKTEPNSSSNQLPIAHDFDFLLELKKIIATSKM